MSRRGRIAGLDENQLESIMVDFEAKSSDEEDSDEEDDFDESRTVPERLIEEVSKYCSCKMMS